MRLCIGNTQMSNRPRIESSAPIPPPDGLENLVALTLFLPIGVLAVVTVITHISQLFELPFRVYAYFSVAVSALFVIPTTYRLAREVATTSPSQRKNGLSLILLGLTGATLAVVSHRVSIDDYGYLANARYFLEYPATPLNLDIHYLFSESEPFQSLTWATSNPYEFLYAVLDFVFEVDFLWAYYVLGPTVVGFLIPLALYSLTRVFVANHVAAFFGVTVALLLVVMLFETTRTFGNFSFVRAVQGKAFVLTICLPALAAASLRFLTNRCLFHWAMVLLICVAGLGASASSIVLLPPLSLMIVGALWGSGGLKISRRAFIRQVILYGSAFTYLIAYAVIYRLYFASDLGLDSPANARWPRSFLRHLAFFWPPGTLELPPPGTLDSIFLSLTPVPYTPVAVTLSIVAAIGFSGGGGGDATLLTDVAFHCHIVIFESLERRHPDTLFHRSEYLLAYVLPASVSVGSGYRRSIPAYTHRRTFQSVSSMGRTRRIYRTFLSELVGTRPDRVSAPLQTATRRIRDRRDDCRRSAAWPYAGAVTCRRYCGHIVGRPSANQHKGLYPGDPTYRARKFQRSVIPREGRFFRALRADGRLRGIRDRAGALPPHRGRASPKDT